MPRVVAAALVSAMGMMVSADLSAADFIKANNGTNLNTASSWVGNTLPTTSDTIVFSDVYQQPGILGTGSPLTYFGVRVTNAAGTYINIDNGTAANFVRIGAGGVDMSAAVRDFRIRNMRINASQTWNINSGVNFTVGGDSTLSGAHSIIKEGAGTVLFNGDGTFTGHITINGGLFDLSNVGQVYRGSGTYSTQVVTVNSGGVLDVRNFGKSTGANTSLGNLDLDAARVVVDGGTIRFNASTNNGRGITVGANGATLQVVSGVNWSQTNANANIYASGAPITFTGAGTGTIENTIDGAGVSLTKNGTSTWILTAANTYTGSTTINNGMLRLTGAGSISASPLITVASGATFDVSGVTGGFTLASGQTLTGVGTVQGALTVGTGSILSPGNSPGTLSLVGNQTWADGGAFLFEIDDAIGSAGNDPGWDLLSITGSLDLSNLSANGFTLDVASLLHATHTTGELDLLPDTEYVWNFVEATAGIIGFDSNLFMIDASGFSSNQSGTFALRQDGNNLSLVFTTLPVPEPTGFFVWGLLGLVTLMMGWRYGRRK